MYNTRDISVTHENDSKSNATGGCEHPPPTHTDPHKPSTKSKASSRSSQWLELLVTTAGLPSLRQ